MKMTQPTCFNGLLAVLLILTSSSATADWNQYRGPSFDGHSSEVINLSKIQGKSLWKVPTTNGFSSFAASGGLVATLVSRQDEDGLQRETCLVLDANSGKQRWAVHLDRADYKHGGGNAGAKGNNGGDGPRTTPTINGDRVYVYDADMNLYCLDAKTGVTIWKKRISKDFAGREIKWKNAVSPIIDKGLVIIPGGGAGQSFLAFHKGTGDLAWKSGDDTMTHATPTIGVIHGIRQAVFFMKSGLVGVAVKDGKILWKQSFRFAVSTAASPIIAGNMVYCSAGYGVGGGLYRISRAGDGFSSKKVWFRKEVVNHWSTPVLYKGHLYGMFSFKKYGNGPVKCIELATGEEKWSAPGFGPGNVSLTGNGRLLALTDNGQIVVIDATSSGYKELAKVKSITGKCWSTPILSGGRIFARSTKEGVCIDVSGG